MADDISMPDTGAEQLRIDIATDNVTGSDMNSLRDAGRALVDRGEMKPSSTEIDPIVVVDAGVLEHDDPDREGIDLRKTAKALSKYHQLKAQQKAQYESAAAQVQDAPQQQTQDEASALLQQLQHGELKAGLETRDNAELERLIIAAQADYPEVAVTASQVLAERNQNIAAHLHDLRQHSEVAIQQEAQNLSERELRAFEFSRNLVANGILARHGLSSPQELAQLQQYDPNRHALVLGELHHADLALANQAHEIKLRLGQRAQLQAQLSQQQFAEMAENEDAKFNSWTEAELNTPELREAACADVLEYLNRGLGLTGQQIAHLWTTNVLFRAAETQLSMWFAARYAKLKRSIAEGQVAAQVAKPTPKVQRPGVHSPTARSDDEIRRAEAAMRDNPSVRNAANLARAKQRARA